MRYKGKRELNRAVKCFINCITEARIRAYIDEEYAYYNDTEIIRYPVTEDNYVNIVWKRYLQKKFKVEPFSMVVFSFLHEIGHYYTMDNFTDKEIKQYLKFSKNLSEKDVTEKTLIQYFDYPFERAATCWAVKYYKKNEKYLKKNFKPLAKAYKEFYKKNPQIGLYKIVLY
jgi:hypothetical protein